MTKLARKKAQKKVAVQRRRMVYILRGILGLLILVAGIVYAVSPPGWAPYSESTYDTVTKSSLKNAIHAQELYFAENDSYKTCVGCTSIDLPGYYSDPKIRLNVEADRDGFILIATHEACRRGQWIYQSAAGDLKKSRPFEGCR